MREKCDVMCRRKWISFCRMRADAQRRMARNTIAFYSQRRRRRHVHAKRERDRLCHCEPCISVWSGLERLLRFASVFAAPTCAHVVEIVSHESSRHKKTASFRFSLRPANDKMRFFFFFFIFFGFLFCSTVRCGLPMPTV